MHARELLKGAIAAAKAARYAKVLAKRGVTAENEPEPKERIQHRAPTGENQPGTLCENSEKGFSYV